MTDRVLERFVRPNVRTPETVRELLPDGTGEETHDYGAFGFLRGLRDRAIMLELRKRDGSIKALGYAWLQMIEFDPSVGITLSFPGSRIRLIGRCLNTELRPGVRLFEGLTRNRVTFVQEAGTDDWEPDAEDQTVIERIEW